ncbi:MAG: galactose oxidase [Tannerellaceae bacterium]|nr:galactose oxidase [Tannerellaceae bacterium]
MIRKKLLLFFIATLPLIITSCRDDDEELIGLWTRKTDFYGTPRSGASAFTIGTKGYVMGGYVGNKPDKELWFYDMNENSWYEINTATGSTAEFKGVARTQAVAVGCELNGKGYYGLGLSQDRITVDTYPNMDIVDTNNDGQLKDWWEFDTNTNTWKRLPDFIGTARYDAIAFCIKDKVYVGLGYDDKQGLVNDIYEYDTTKNEWKEHIGYVGSKRRGASVFVIDDIAYIFGGENNGTYEWGFHSFDPSKTGADRWAQLRDIADTNTDEDYDDDYTIVRAYASTFVIDGCGYVTCGYQNGLRTDTWRYYPSTDLWEKVAKFKGSARQNAVSFSTGNPGQAFVLTGKSGTYFFDDMWTLDPYTYDDEDY